MSKKNKALYRAKDYDPSCELCRHGKLSPDGKSVLCCVRGVMRRTSLCKKYEYDPIKRQPKCAPALPEFDPEQFLL